MPSKKVITNYSKPAAEPIVEEIDDDDMEEVFPTIGPYQCEICHGVTHTKVEFVAHIKAKHRGIVDKDVLRSLESDIRKAKEKEMVAAKLIKTETEAVKTQNNTPSAASKNKPQPTSAAKKTTPNETEKVFPNNGPCEICLAFYQEYFLPMAQYEFQAHIKAKHGGIVPEDVQGIVKWQSRSLESDESDDESEEDVAAKLNKMISKTISNNTPASAQISSAKQGSCPTQHETIEPSKVKTRTQDPRSNAKTNGDLQLKQQSSVPSFDSRSNGEQLLEYVVNHNKQQLKQLSSVPELPWNSTRLKSEQKAKTWVVKENKEEPWNMEKVLEELGEVLIYFLTNV